jgi:hypothetical protein
MYDKLKHVDNDKFENGYGFITDIAGLTVGFLAYNSGGQKNLGKSDVINLPELAKLSNYQVDDSIILHIQAHYMEKAEKITKMELGGNDLDFLIITNHNVDDVETYKK